MKPVTRSPSLGEAARALIEAEYGLNVARFVHLATHSNVLYRVDLTDGRRLVLRVGEVAANTRANLEIEVAWLSSLRRDPNLNLAAPVPTPDGRLVVELEHGGRRDCVLFTWVPGHPMGDGAGTSGYRAMGRLAARLHDHSHWRPPAGLELRRGDRTFYYPEAIDPIVIDDFRYEHLFRGLKGMMRRTAAMVDDYLVARWSEEPPGVVHGDLHEWNVHLHMGRAWAIDFEDVMLALPAQDIATSLYGARTRPDLPAVVAAFREGYEESRPWPVRGPEELELLWAGRQVLLMNHAAQVLPEADVLGYFEAVVPWLRAYLDRAPAPTPG